MTRPPCWSRRDFLIATSAGCAALALPACAEEEGLDVLSSDLPINLTQNPALKLIGQTNLWDAGLTSPLAITRMDEETFLITGTECNHQHCTVEPHNDGWACPCHGARFSFDGAITRGPATLPLTRYDWTLDGDTLTIRGQ